MASLSLAPRVVPGVSWVSVTGFVQLQFKRTLCVAVLDPRCRCPCLLPASGQRLRCWQQGVSNGSPMAHDSKAQGTVKVQSLCLPGIMCAGSRERAGSRLLCGGFSVETAEQAGLAPLQSSIPVRYLRLCKFSVPGTLSSRFFLVRGVSRGEGPCPLSADVVTEQKGPFLRTLAFCKQQ